jgi:hypothetical protein
MSARLEVLVRGRFIPIAAAKIAHLRANVWQVRIPRTPEIDRSLRGALEQSEIIVCLDGVEADQAIVSAEDPDGTTLTVLLP